VTSSALVPSSPSAALPTLASPSPTPSLRARPVAAATRQRGRRPPRPKRRGKLGRGCVDALHSLPPIRTPPLPPHTHCLHALPPLFPRALHSARCPLLEFTMVSVSAAVLGRLWPELFIAAKVVLRIRVSPWHDAPSHTRARSLQPCAHHRIRTSCAQRCLLRKTQPKFCSNFSLVPSKSDEKDRRD
jgi:hypothetical protein